MKAGDPVGTPVDKGPWVSGTWVWHVRTKKGPWIVVEDKGGDLVYVDTKPNRPATQGRDLILDPHRFEVTLSHPDVEHHYRSVLTDKVPEQDPPWHTRVNWQDLGTGAAAFFSIIVSIVFVLIYLWLEAGAPM